MKTTLIATVFFLTGISINGQQISLGEISRNAKFNKTIDEINNGKAVLKYSDIQGNPFYKNGFNNAKVGDTGTILPVRYNLFKDSFEILNDNDIYSVPKDNSFSKFTFLSSNEKFILDKDNDGIAGYFLILTEGHSKLLKKFAVKFIPEIPAPNTMISGTPAKFENLKPVYYLKTEDNLIKISKKADDLINALPTDKKDAVKDFIKTNKIKLTEELDLIKLTNFLNK